MRIFLTIIITIAPTVTVSGAFEFNMFDIQSSGTTGLQQPSSGNFNSGISSNPATLTDLKASVLGCGGGFWLNLTELPLFYLKAGLPISQFKTSLNIQYFGPAWYREWSSSFSIATRPAKLVSIGFRLDWNNLYIENGPQDYSFSLSAGSILHLNNYLRLSFALQNFNTPQLPGDPLHTFPLKMDFGIRCQPFDNLELLLNTQCLYEHKKTRFQSGGGVQWLPFQKLALRCGVSSPPLVLRGGISLSLDTITLDYALICHTTLQTFTHLIGISCRLSNNKKESFPIIQKININSAGLLDLAHLPGISSITAARIIALRKKHSFVNNAQLLSVPGITFKKYKKFSGLISCSDKGARYLTVPQFSKLSNINGMEFSHLLQVGFQPIDAWNIIRFRENGHGYRNKNDLKKIPELSIKGKCLLKSLISKTGNTNEKN